MHDNQNAYRQDAKVAAAWVAQSHSFVVARLLSMLLLFGTSLGRPLQVQCTHPPIHLYLAVLELLLGEGLDDLESLLRTNAGMWQRPGYACADRRDGHYRHYGMCEGPSCQEQAATLANCKMQLMSCVC